MNMEREITLSLGWLLVFILAGIIIGWLGCSLIYEFIVERLFWMFFTDFLRRK